MERGGGFVTKAERAAEPASLTAGHVVIVWAAEAVYGE